MKSSGTARSNLTFVIADDHRMLRDALRAILLDEGHEVIGEASDGDEALRLCRELQPDFVLLDLSMPVLDGVQTARMINKDHRNTKIIVLSIHSDGKHIAESLGAGAVGYVVKTKAACVLLTAIDAACRGETYVSETTAAQCSELPL